MDNLDPYRRGFRARMAGDALSKNPFPAGSHDAERWLLGWQDQDEHLSDRDDALAPLFSS